MEENNSVADVATDLPTFDVTDTILRESKVKVGSGKVNLTFELRQPTLAELKDKENKQPYRSVASGTEEEQVLSDFTGKAEASLFDKLVVSTKGYGANVVPNQSQEEREAALKGIPPTHKVDIVRAILKVDSEIIYDDEQELDSFVWSEEQEYRVRTEIGDTGNFVSHFTVKEMSQKQLEKYNGATKFFIEKGGKKPVNRISVDIVPGVELFDQLVVGAEGLSVGQEPLNVKLPEHLSKIPAHIKRSVVDAVMAGTRLELGN
jgi:hypothetical protein